MKKIFIDGKSMGSAATVYDPFLKYRR